MRVHIGSDHAGYEIKNFLKEKLISRGFDVVDHGAYELNHEDDYPEFIYPVAYAVQADSESRGIVLGGSGQAEAMLVNKIEGIRCGIFYGPRLAIGGLSEHAGTPTDDPFDIVRLFRQHNNAQVLSLGARFISEKEALDAVEIFLDTRFDGEVRHRRRLEQFPDASSSI